MGNGNFHLPGRNNTSSRVGVNWSSMEWLGCVGCLESPDSRTRPTCVFEASNDGLWSGPRETGWVVTLTPDSRTRPTSPDLARNG